MLCSFTSNCDKGTPPTFSLLFHMNLKEGESSPFHIPLFEWKEFCSKIEPDSFFSSFNIQPSTFCCYCADTRAWYWTDAVSVAIIILHQFWNILKKILKCQMKKKSITQFFNYFMFCVVLSNLQVLHYEYIFTMYIHRLYIHIDLPIFVCVFKCMYMYFLYLLFYSIVLLLFSLFCPLSAITVQISHLWN